MPNSTDQCFSPPPKIVKPRGRTYQRLPVVAINGQQTLNEDGEMGKIMDLVAALPTMQPTLFVKYNAADFVAGLDITYAKTHKNWQWHATEREKGITAPNGVRVAARITTTIHFFGFKERHYHKIIDPVAMHARSIDDIWPGPEPKIVRLLRWAVALRDFCDINQLDIRPTTGGISAQFLTDRRFYPDARRKVPRLTNDRVREELPGNFYHLSVDTGPEHEYTAYYLDQSRAHHYHARQTALPDANGLYAIGRFQDLGTCVFPDVWDSFCGLYCLDLVVPKGRRSSRFVRAWLRQKPTDLVLEKRFIYSNELPLLQDMGYGVSGVRAAWGSHRQDTGLSKYADWAIEQLDLYSDAPWLKPILLSTYGTLATRPKIAEAIYKQCKRGEPVTLLVGRNKLRGTLTKGRLKLEPRIANVLHRGMIEAGTRVESLYYAVHLEINHYQVLSVYADAVIVKVDDDQELPLIIDPWRLKQTLNHLQFINTQSFQSGEMTRMPGVPGAARDAMKHRQISPGQAPRIVEKYEALSGRRVWVDTRTNKKVEILDGNVRQATIPHR